MMPHSLRTSLLAAALTTLSACGGGSSGDEKAYLSLGIVDAPVDGAQNVFVQFSGVELHGPDGTVAVTFATPKKLDLLALTGTNDAPLLSDYALTAGEYQWIRLMVDTDGALDTYLVDSNGASHELTIPSGSQTGLKLNRGFTLAQGGRASFTIDFDLRRSLVQDSGGYKLKPTLRLVNSLEVGTLTGTVATSLLAANCGSNEFGAVYVYDGTVTPDDVDGAGVEPLTSASVKTDGSNAYTIGFLATGPYTVAWTCDADLDNPLTDELHDPTVPADTVHFFGTAPATISANATTTVNFGG